MTDQVQVYVPADSAARSVGADGLAQAVLDLAPDVNLRRPGSRGLYWLEPTLEVHTDQGRIGFGPLQPGQVPEVLDPQGKPRLDHPQCLGPLESFELLARQQRLTFSPAVSWY